MQRHVLSQALHRLRTLGTSVTTSTASRPRRTRLLPSVLVEPSACGRRPSQGLRDGISRRRSPYPAGGSKAYEPAALVEEERLERRAAELGPRLLPRSG